MALGTSVPVQCPHLANQGVVVVEGDCKLLVLVPLKLVAVGGYFWLVLERLKRVLVLVGQSVVY